MKWARRWGEEADVMQKQEVRVIPGGDGSQGVQAAASRAAKGEGRFSPRVASGGMYLRPHLEFTVLYF